jgi:CubicO group peptidase (beta-lactamase class C family)
MRLRRALNYDRVFPAAYGDAQGSHEVAIRRLRPLVDKLVEVKHILNQTSGITLLSREGPAPRYISERSPGEQFRYSNDVVEILGDIIYASTGVQIDEYLWSNVLRKIGIRKRPWVSQWRSRASVSSGLVLNARELARIGALMLKKGAWHGEAVVPSAWVEQCIKPAGPNQLWYGYLWWLYPEANPTSDFRVCFHNDGARIRQGFYAHGWMGQVLYVCPALQGVAVRQYKMLKKVEMKAESYCKFDGFICMASRLLHRVAANDGSVV